MSAAAVRSVLRPSRLALRRAPARHASTASDVAAKAKDTASQATSKASEGLTKVTQSAGSAASSAGQGVSNAAGSASARAGGLVSTVQSLIPPTIYYARVGGELAKMIFHGQKMYPPTTAQFRTYFDMLLGALRKPSTLFAQNPGLFSPQQYLNYFRNIDNRQLATIGVVFAEVIGFFTVGEMLGRLKIVGYRGGAPAHH